jgi:hypothetical protein
MTNLELFHQNRPIELHLPGTTKKLVLDLVIFKSFENEPKRTKFHFLKMKPINIKDFDYFTNKVLFFYVHRQLKKYLRLFYINETFYFELID